MMHYYYGGSPYHFFGLGSIVSIIFWVFVVYLIVSVIRNNRMHHFGGFSNQRPMDILKSRYAKGEITKEQFESMKKDLE